MRDENFGFLAGMDKGGEEASVGVDVGEVFWGQREDGRSCLQNGGERFHAEGDAGEDDVGVELGELGEILFRGGPGVGEDG